MKKNKKIDMTELISLYIQKKQVGVFPLHEPWIDIGSHEDYDKAQNI
jgi:NDP-sugar pyrophosphorylase family protein